MAKDWKSMERGIARILGDWWGVPFRRTPSSGAWNTQSKHMGHGSTDFHGDIVAPPEANFPFSVECKAYKEVEIYKALYGKSNVFEWWKQTCVDARDSGKIPMLIMKENRKQPLVVISWRVYATLFLQQNIKGIPPRSPVILKLQWCPQVKGKSIVIMDLHLFVESVSSNYVKKVLNA